MTYIVTAALKLKSFCRFVFPNKTCYQKNDLKLDVLRKKYQIKWSATRAKFVLQSITKNNIAKEHSLRYIIE